MSARSRSSVIPQPVITPSQATETTSTAPQQSDATTGNRFYVVAEFWYAEDVSAFKGDGSQVVAVLDDWEAATDFARKYRKHCKGQIIEEEPDEDRNWLIQGEGEKLKNDGTMTYTLG